MKNAKDNLLREAAIKASECAYSPYSNKKVGSALQTDSGKIYSGANIENASYGGTVCAERVAIWKAVSENEKKWSSIYVFSKAGWSPCGMCRQVMVEFASPDLNIIIGNASGEETHHKLKDLMPLSFSPEEMGQ